MRMDAERLGGHVCWWAFLALTVPVLVAVIGCPPGGDETTGPERVGPGVVARPVVDVWPPRAVWVPRQAYKSPEQIADLMERIRQAGFNVVLFQVRGNGTAYYRSSIEPLAYEYGGDPGFDPLTVACEQAHQRGLALHAWVNVMPGWSGQSPPPDNRQLYHAHPEWFWYDQRGQRQPLGGFYVSVNPCLPEVRAYLVGVFEEIVREYPVDGLHLDYIRFPTDESPKGSDYPYDRKTLALYKQATGKSPADDRTLWSQWRTDQVTRLVHDIRIMTRQVRPGLKLTAACTADVNEGRRYYYQDGPAWIRSGLVDLVFVMNYTSKDDQFRGRQMAWHRAAGRQRAAAGIGVYLHKADRITTSQIEQARQWGSGLALFSSNCLFDNSPSSRGRLAAVQPMLMEMRAEALRKAKRHDSPVSVRVGVTGHAGQSSDRTTSVYPGMVP